MKLQCVILAGLCICMMLQWFVTASLKQLHVQIREQYPLTGEVRRFKRRDLRKGMSHTGVPPQAGLLAHAFAPMFYLVGKLLQAALVTGLFVATNLTYGTHVLSCSLKPYSFC